MTTFRKRWDMFNINELNDIIFSLKLSSKKESADSSDSSDDEDSSSGDSSSANKESIDNDSQNNCGRLIVDASCVPADISYPNDVKLLHESIRKSCLILDTLWENYKGKQYSRKPRTYRKKIEKLFKSFIKKKAFSRKNRKRVMKQQLTNLKNNLKHIDTLLEDTDISCLSSDLYRYNLIIREVYSQQKEMFDKNSYRIKDRIVNIHQPHIRPIVRGKAGAKTEFGAKISISVIDKFTFLDTVDFNAYNEGNELIAQIEQYKEKMGYYPESVHADKIYRNKVNRKYCKERGIRLSGPSLGRPPKDPIKNKEQKLIAQRDEGIRSAVEGKFGVLKRKFTLDRLMTKLKTTSETIIALCVFVMNLELIAKNRIRTLFILKKFQEFYLNLQTYILMKRYLNLFS
jgi:hypothetical protein